MPVEQLWQPHDQRAAERLRRAIDQRDLASALLAVEDPSPDDEAAARATLDRLAAEAREALRDAPSPADQARALRSVLGEFIGDRTDYHAPDNSHLTRVLDRRRGLPILLSAVWMLVGEAAGVEVHGLGLPGHFLARVGGPSGTLVDPFAGGTALDDADGPRLVARLSGGSVPWRDEYLRPVRTEALIERVLRNLVNAHQRSSDLSALYRTARLWSTLRPDLPEASALVAQVERRLGFAPPGGGPLN